MGVWTHPYFPGFERPASGPGADSQQIAPTERGRKRQPVRWRLHKPDPEAGGCRAVKRHGEISFAGGPIRGRA
jgi:hypothetical protein